MTRRVGEPRPGLKQPGRLASRPDTRWSDRAACLGMAAAGADPWHPDGEGNEARAGYAVARRICAGCPVRRPCLRDGLALLEAGVLRGMWAGRSPSEMRELARSRERDAA